MIIVLSPSSQILSAECLTDPTGKSFTPRLPAPAVPWEVILSTCRPFLSRSTPQSAHSAVVRLSFPGEVKSLTFISDYQSPEACHQRSFANGFTGPCLHARTLFDFPKSQAPPVPLPRSLFHSLLVWSSCSRTHSFARLSFDCPSQEDSSLSFIWLNYYAGFAEGAGMSDTSLNDQPPLPPASSSVCLPAFFLH